MQQTTIDILNPKDFIKGLKALNKLRDKKNTADCISWSIVHDKLTITLIADQGTIYTMSYELCEEITQSPLKFVSNLSNLISFDCKDNNTPVRIFLDGTKLCIINEITQQLVYSPLLDKSNYHYDNSIVNFPDLKFYNLSNLKKIFQGINAKELDNKISINIIDNMLIIKSDNRCNNIQINLLRCK